MYIGSVTSKHVGRIRDDILILSNIPGYPPIRLRFECTAPGAGLVGWSDFFHNPVEDAPGPFEVDVLGVLNHRFDPPLRVHWPVLPFRAHIPVLWIADLAIVADQDFYFRYQKTDAMGVPVKPPIYFRELLLRSQIQTSTNAIRRFVYIV
jgi:hypothetical protein